MGRDFIMAAPIQAKRKIRCFTRALKNARFLQQQDSASFTKGADAGGFGTGVPMEILHVLHRLSPDSPELQSHGDLIEFLKKHKVPGPERWQR
jgi:hypothetical protein